MIDSAFDFVGGIVEGAADVMLKNQDAANNLSAAAIGNAASVAGAMPVQMEASAAKVETMAK